SVGEKLIEEFMLATNETIAEHFHWMDVPFIHRIHEAPDEAKLNQFFEFLAGLGYRVKGTANEIHPVELQKVLERVRGETEEMVVSKLTSRSRRQAKYDPNSVGHFGLSTQFYTDVAAPIRRYPDLTVQRLIRTYLIEGNLGRKPLKRWNDLLSDVAKHTSEVERTGIAAERDVDDLKKAAYMADKL